MGVRQPGSGAPGVTKPSQSVRLGWSPPVIQEASRQPSRTGREQQKVLPQFEEDYQQRLIPSPSPVLPVPVLVLVLPPLLLTGLRCAPELRLSAALVRKQTARGGRKTTTVAAREVVLDSLASEHLCGCSPAPLSPPSLPPSPPPRCTLAGGLSLVGHMLRPLREWAGVGREGDVLEKLKVMW